MPQTQKRWILPLTVLLLFAGSGIVWPQSRDDDAINVLTDPCSDTVTDCCVSGVTSKLTAAKLLKAAAKCRGSDNFNICDPDEQEAYSSYLEFWAGLLEEHETAEPIERLAIQKEIISLNGRKKNIQSVGPDQCEAVSCEACEDTTCRERCLKIREQMTYWRNRYKNTMQGNEYLDCRECLEVLEAYYNAQLQLYNEKQA